MAIWTIQAKRQLRHSPARALYEHSRQPGNDCLKPIDEKAKQLDEMLAGAFPDAAAVVVRDVMIGFRRKHGSAPRRGAVRRDDRRESARRRQEQCTGKRGERLGYGRQKRPAMAGGLLRSDRSWPTT